MTSCRQRENNNITMGSEQRGVKKNIYIVYITTLFIIAIGVSDI